MFTQLTFSVCYLFGDLHMHMYVGGALCICWSVSPLCLTWRVIAAFVDCWRQVVSHLVTAGKREGWRGFGDGNVELWRKKWIHPTINHTWINSRHRGNGMDWRMGEDKIEWKIEIKEVLSYFENCLIRMCGHAQLCGCLHAFVTLKE